ncbi:beta-galactosidase [Streptomyces sp. NRRL WC-3549]|uniref:beta-galactosidase n=1 Tax=Streptomyces sp. NRRL WC-3549 TaxID=1463925 RepID=UPI003B63BDCD
MDGERPVAWFGRFHYWRLPGPDRWRDVLQKRKASGFNAVSTYSRCPGGATTSRSRAPTASRLSGVRDIDRPLIMAEQEGPYGHRPPRPVHHRLPCRPQRQHLALRAGLAIDPGIPRTAALHHTQRKGTASPAQSRDDRQRHPLRLPAPWRRRPARDRPPPQPSPMGCAR